MRIEIKVAREYAKTRAKVATWSAPRLETVLEQIEACSNNGTAEDIELGHAIIRAFRDELEFRLSREVVAESWDYDS
ncbi:MAG TPA: hypothetical protein VN939_05425 [Chthoniobacterales bacterium]|nr:hypothetical protein [Chthoniobacterales bacterium]